MNIKELESKLQSLSYSLDRALKESGYKDNLDLSEIEYTPTDPQERFLKAECEAILENLMRAVDELEYLSKPIGETGKLYKAENGRYRATDGRNEWEYSSGSGIEFLVNEIYEDENGQETEVGRWIASSVESQNGRYYIVHYPNLELEGLTVRKRIWG